MEALIVAGAPGSPYTRKVLAALRYRGVPHRFVSDLATSDALPQPRVKLWPVVYFSDGEGGLTPTTDSTPILRRLESGHPGPSLVPEDPRVAFLDALVEDYADEWLTKSMFHYRWTYRADIAKSARVLPNWFESPLDEHRLAQNGKAFAERQIGRLGIVGSNSVTAATIEGSFVALLDILEQHLSAAQFLWGTRPGAADFGLMGQLTQLALFDPTPSALVAERAPRVLAWTIAMEDLSGWGERAWTSFEDLPETIEALLEEIGATYAPLLLANAAAVKAGQAEVRTSIRGAAWVQPAFPYQLKCLRALQDQYAALSADSQQDVRRLLRQGGCLNLFSDAG